MKQKDIYYIAVCDDEMIYRNQIMNVIQEYMFLNEKDIDIRLFSTGTEFCDFCKKYKVNMVFLDIELGDINGFCVAHYIREELNDHNMHIVFQTDTKQYDRQLFSVQPLDVIEKPIDTKHIIKCLDLVFNIKESKNTKFIYTNQYERKYVLESDIIAFSKNGKDVEIYLDNYESDWFRGTIKEVEGKIKGEYFVKINQSVIINMCYIKSFNKDKVIMTNGREYKVSREYKKKLLKDADSPLFSQNNPTFNKK